LTDVTLQKNFTSAATFILTQIWFVYAGFLEAHEDLVKVILLEFVEQEVEPIFVQFVVVPFNFIHLRVMYVKCQFIKRRMRQSLQGADNKEMYKKHNKMMNKRCQTVLYAQWNR